MNTKYFYTWAILLFAGTVLGQSRVSDLGLEVQVYPTGLIPGVRFEKSFNKRDLWTVRLGYQIIDHRDQGKHDEEKGSGFGGSAGFKHYFEPYFYGPSLGARVDAWRNNLDWKTKSATGDIKGNSEVTVIQPTVEIGWAFLVGDDVVLTPGLAFGFELNVKTVGEETGEGFIALAGITAAYRFQ